MIACTAAVDRGVAQFNLTAKDKLSIEKRAARFGATSVRSEPLQLSINSYAVRILSTTCYTALFCIVIAHLTPLSLIFCTVNVPLG